MADEENECTVMHMIWRMMGKLIKTTANRRFRKRWRRPPIWQVCGTAVDVIRRESRPNQDMHMPYKSTVPAKLQDPRPSPSFTKSSIAQGWCNAWQKHNQNRRRVNASIRCRRGVGGGGGGSGGKDSEKPAIVAPRSEVRGHCWNQWQCRRVSKCYNIFGSLTRTCSQTPVSLVTLVQSWWPGTLLSCWHDNRRFRKRWRRLQILQFCGDDWLIRLMHVLI